jgi:hypothetical protein
MAFTPEDGTGLPDANSLVSVEFIDAYYELSPYGAAWAAKTTEQKQQIAACATRSLCAAVVWKGAPVNPGVQGVDFPRIGIVISYVVDGPVVTGNENMSYPAYYQVPGDIVPKPVQQAAAEYCRYIVISDRAVERDTSTIKMEKVGPIEVEYFEATAPDILPTEVIRMLTGYVAEAPSSTGAAAASVARGRRS